MSEKFDLPMPNPDPLLPEPEDGGDEPILLICGDCPQARALAGLAARCGFIVEAAIEEDGEFQHAENVFVLPGFENLEEEAEIGRSHYVCIFARDEQGCLTALSEALESHAFYIGVWASPAERDELFAKLRGQGVPEAELAPVCCPIGLSIYAENPMQAAVAVLAEMLAARAGTLGRLRLDEDKQ